MGNESQGGKGVPMSGLEESPARRKRRAEGPAAEEERWAARSGPVEILVRDPVTGEIRHQQPKPGG
jgi:hypothetical protein